MFFFSRKGYLSEIKRLQIANNDLQEALLKHQDTHKTLIDRILALTDPIALRESRRGEAEVKPGDGLVPQALSERRFSPKRAYRENRSKVRPPLKIDFSQSSEKDQAAVAKIMAASVEDGN